MILIFGGSGFVGRRLAKGLLAGRHAVRCMVRDPTKVADLAAAGAEIVRGDLSDEVSIDQAMAGARAVYLAVHTLSVQPASTGGDFMDIEATFVSNVVAAARRHDVRRAVYVTSCGVAANGPGAWLRGRARTELMLLESGIDATVIRPGQIVGRGGRGFDAIMANAERRIAFLLAGGHLRLRPIAIDDLVEYLVAALDEPLTFGRQFDVGSNDVLTIRAMTDIAAEVLGRPHPFKVPIPRVVLGFVAPLVERVFRIPRGSIRGLLDSLSTDDVGDPAPIRHILPRPLLSYREALRLVVENEHVVIP